MATAKHWKRELIDSVINSRGGPAFTMKNASKSVTPLGRLMAFGEYIERREAERAARRSLAIKAGVLFALAAGVAACVIFSN